MFERFSLKNGVRVVFSPMPQVKSVTVLVLVKTGSRFEEGVDQGISHFLEHMIFKGTKKRPSPLEISYLIDSVGGSSNAFTSKEYTGFYIKAPVEHLDLVLDLLSDVLKDSLFLQEEIEKERGVVIEEINMVEDEPQAKIGEVYQALVYKGHHLGNPILGPKENIASMDRERVVSYFGKHYNTSSMVISVAGGVEKEVLAEKLMMYFDGVKEGDLPDYKKFVNDQKKSRVAVHFKQTDQAYLGLGVHTFGRTSPDRYALNLLHNILGETMSSRLWNEIREKRGLAYFVGTDIERYSDCGSLLAIAGVKISSIEEVVKLVCEQFVLVKEKGVTNEELVRAKQMWKGKMILGFEDSYNVAAWYGTQELLDDEVKLPDDVLSKTDLVTSEDILRVSQNIFKDSFLNLAVLGPFKDEVKFSELLKI